MGTSGSNSGTNGSSTPLIPDWLNAEAPDSTSQGQNIPASNPTVDNPIEGGEAQTTVDQPQTPLASSPAQERYREARSNFTRYVRSGGSSTRSLRRAVSGYVRKSSGGAKQAARKMGSSRKTSAKLLSFLSEAAKNGIETALKSLKLDKLVGRPIDEIFIGISEYICPEGSTTDNGIARDAFFETIADLATEGISDFDDLSIEQVQAVFELYISHTIEEKIFNEIGNKALFQSKSETEALYIENQVYDFIQKGVSDALVKIDFGSAELTPETSLSIVDSVYEEAFILLSALDQEGELE